MVARKLWILIIVAVIFAAFELDGATSWLVVPAIVGSLLLRSSAASFAKQIFAELTASDHQANINREDSRLTGAANASLHSEKIVCAERYGLRCAAQKIASSKLIDVNLADRLLPIPLTVAALIQGGRPTPIQRLRKILLA